MNTLLNTKLENILFSEAPIALAIFDKNLCYLFSTKKWLADYGMQGLNIIGLCHYDVFPEIGEEWKAIHQDCLQGNTRKSDEDMFVRQNGSVQWLKWEVKPWYEDDREIGGLIMYSEDISMSKNTNQMLIESYSIARIGGWEFNVVENKITWSLVTKQIHEVDEDYQPDLSSGIR